MTLSDAAGLALKVHGAVWLAAVAAYYKYGDRTDLFEKALRGNQSLRQAVRDNIATDLSKQLQPVIRDAICVRSPVLDAGGDYVERVTDITKSELYYQAIRDYVSRSTGLAPGLPGDFGDDGLLAYVGASPKSIDPRARHTGDSVNFGRSTGPRGSRPKSNRHKVVVSGIASPNECRRWVIVLVPLRCSYETWRDG